MAPRGQVSVFHLDPLTEEQVSDILAANSTISDSENQWPSTRQETFQLACEKLATELNVEHRSATRFHVPDSSAWLSAAGGLCALQLLADISGFTTSGESKAGIVALRDIACLKELAITKVLKTRLFAGMGEDKFAPVHRSVLSI